jgi:Ankyrin repeats (many copies)/Ankyrin repeat
VAGGSTALDGLIAAIARGDQRRARQLLAADPGLAGARVDVGATRAEARAHFIDDIGHYVYAGDTALHIAAAAHSADLVAALTAEGADVAAANRRGAYPLHYAVDGGPNSAAWDPDAQAETVRRLLEAGADPDAVDRGGVTPLHRAIRNRCAAAVEVLLTSGADARRPNGRGSTPWQLAQWTTGKGGSGSDAAKQQQARILRLLEEHDAASR